MTEEFAKGLVDFFHDKIPNELIIFLVSLLPVLELRGGMIAAKLLHVDFLRAFIICYIGNILPIPFILLFIRKIFQFLRHILPRKGYNCHPAAALCAAVRQQHGHTVASL